MMMHEYRDLFKVCFEKINIKYSDYPQSPKYIQINNWNEVFTALIKLQEIDFFKEDFTKIIAHGMQFNNDNNTPTILKDKFTGFKNDVDYIRKKCEGVVEFIDFFYKDETERSKYIYMKLPENLNFIELQAISYSMSKIFKMSPMLVDCRNAKVIGVEKGSSFLTILLANAIEITSVLIAFGTFLKLVSETYKNYGEGYYNFQKGKTEKYNREQLKSFAKKKKLNYDDDTITTLEKFHREQEQEGFREYVLKKHDELKPDNIKKLDGNEESKLIKSVEEAIKLFACGVQFEMSAVSENEEARKQFPVKEDYPMITVKVEDILQLPNNNNE